MANTKMSKTETGDADSGNRTGAEYVGLAAALTAYKSITMVLAAGPEVDTRVCKIDIRPDADTAAINGLVQAVDAVTGANIREVKQTIGVNSMLDKPALSQNDKQIALVTYDTLFGDGRKGKDYLRIPYSPDVTTYAALEQYLNSAAIAGVPNATKNGFTTPGIFAFKGSPVYYELNNISKVRDKN